MQGINVVWRDLVLLLLFVVIGVLLVLLPHLNPIMEEEDKEIETQGKLAVTTHWKYGVDIDVDVWVKDPKYIISYKQKHQPSGDLLRDDLGTGGAQGDDNFEIIFLRSLVPGKYTVALHLYGLGGQKNAEYLPLSVDVKVDLLAAGSKPKNIFDGTLKLKHKKQELTVVSFSIGEDENLISGSISHMQNPVVYGGN